MVFSRCGFKSYQTFRKETKAVGNCFESIRFEQCYFKHLIKANTSNEDTYNVPINFISKGIVETIYTLKSINAKTPNIGTIGLFPTSSSTRRLMKVNIRYLLNEVKNVFPEYLSQNVREILGVLVLFITVAVQPTMAQHTKRDFSLAGKKKISVLTAKFYVNS